MAHCASGERFPCFGSHPSVEGQRLDKGLFHSLGKSLFVDNTIGKVCAQLGGTLLLHKTIRLMESDIDYQFLVEELFSVNQSVTEIQPSVFHIDVSPVVSAWILEQTRRGGETRQTLHTRRERRGWKLKSSPIRTASVFWQASASIFIWFSSPARYRKVSTGC